MAVQATYRWDDVGSWLAMERMNPQDADGNTILATHAGLHTRDCVIVGDAQRLIATIGVDNLLIVQDGNATLIADKREGREVVRVRRRPRLVGVGHRVVAAAEGVVGHGASRGGATKNERAPRRPLVAGRL